jgi:predicted transcriptional regulator of viral defense system
MNTIDITSKVVFTRKEILPLFSSASACRYWLEMAIENRLIERIRRDMYAVIDLTTGSVYANKFLIGSCISQTAYISYHGALEYHGLANQAYATLYVSDSKKFRPFEYGDVRYEYVFSNNHDWLDQVNYGAILRVTNKERTIIDCLDKLKYGGGIEEVIYALDAVKHLKEQYLLEILKQYDNNRLYQKAGYLFSMFKEELSLSEAFFCYIQSQVGEGKKYWLTNMGMPCVYHPDWKLYAPAYESLEIILYGGR